MENGPKMPHEQPSWQDITVETVHKLMAESKLAEAKMAASIRKEALLQICEDIKDAIDKNAGEITPQEWVAEMTALEKEITELEKILTTIATETRDE